MSGLNCLLYSISLPLQMILSITKKLRARAYQIGTPVQFIRIKESNHVISVHQSIMVVKTSILIPRAHQALRWAFSNNSCFIICNDGS